MSTTVLAYLILFVGFITFLSGAFAALMLLFEEVAKTGRVPFRYYAMMLGLISGGLGNSLTFQAFGPRGPQLDIA
jgi:undecaprenyl pyrophosphate phosphatase UppP